LAGLKLPVSKQNTGPGPEVELYPGSVEHFRAYFMKYLPVRSFFDKQSQVKNWTAPSIPGAEGAKAETYASPVYAQPKNGNATDTGNKLPPVPVVRCSAAGPVFKLDLGTLDRGLYAVRVIGAVEKEKLRRFREPLYVTMRVNDGLQGEVNAYRVRIGYVDEFYSVAEIYFHATEKRRFQAEVSVDKGSAVELLVHNISLDDVLAGSIRRPIKTRRTVTTDEEIAQIRAGYDAAERKPFAALPVLAPEERLARDAAIWKWFPPLNAQGLYIHGPLPEGAVEGVADKTKPEVETEFGRWEVVGGEIMNLEEGTLTRNPKLINAFLVNKKLGLEYTVDDLWARKPLPDPFPYKDDGAGLYFPDPNDPSKGRVFAPIAAGVHRRVRPGPMFANSAANHWLQSGHRDLARDAAVDLIRYAYQLPAIDDARSFVNKAIRIPGDRDQDGYCRQRGMEQAWRSHYQNYLHALHTYDKLFEFIQGNEDLAQSIHRFVPWVKTSADLVELLDVYLVQSTAKRILRYHTHTLPMAISVAAVTLGDNGVTDPWMEWLFAKTFVYPLAPAGAQDLMIVGHDREGPQYIGSTYYSQEQGARRIAAELDPYLRAGGNPQYNLADPTQYPKPLASCYWQLNTIIAGADFARIGDVNGPDKSPFFTVGKGLAEASRFGWRWSGDPRFAWILKNVFGRKDETPEVWNKIEAAAAAVKRAPWLDLPSRVVDNWFGALESGLAHDDHRFRRAVYVRTGIGSGHAHADTLDLQFVAHGLPMTIDGGQRSGYSKPNDKFSRIHNTVEVDGAGNGEYGLSSAATIQTLTDAEGARYLRANAVPPDNARLYRRQVALIDVDEGRGSQPLSVAQQKPGAPLPKEVTTANSYLFDVFRVAGGRLHTYCFHGPVNDDFQWNAADAKPVEHVPAVAGVTNDAAYLSLFSGSPASKQAGRCPAIFEATWRYSREGVGSEKQMLGANFNPDAPRKFTRLAMLDAGGLRALKADVVTTTQSPVQYRFSTVMLQRRGEKLESAFAAIIEPYAGERFIASEQPLAIENNETDALRAVAVEVKTRDGRTDVCFADGRPEKVREVGAFKMAGEFGYVSTDSNGLRQATLTGGTQLEGPGLAIKLAARAHTGTVTKVDYPAKALWIDAPWPAACGGGAFEIGVPGHWTTYTAASVAPEGKGSKLTVTRGADFYRSAITPVVAGSNRVDCVLAMPVGRENTAGWVASNEQRTKFWRVANEAGNNFKLLDGVASEKDFAPDHVLRLWEYGVGDTVRLATFASVRRVASGEYEVTGNADVEVALGGAASRQFAASELPARLKSP
jgi:hypothetical protein